MVCASGAPTSTLPSCILLLGHQSRLIFSSAPERNRKVKSYLPQENFFSIMQKTVCTSSGSPQISSRLHRTRSVRLPGRSILPVSLGQSGNGSGNGSCASPCSRTSSSFLMRLIRESCTSVLHDLTYPGKVLDLMGLDRSSKLQIRGISLAHGIMY